MYRPEGWFNPHELTDLIYNPELQIIDKSLSDAYEAGADAMLEALKAQGVYNSSGYGRTDFPRASFGWFAFIPDD